MAFHSNPFPCIDTHPESNRSMTNLYYPDLLHQWCFCRSIWRSCHSCTRRYCTAYGFLASSLSTASYYQIQRRTLVALRSSNWIYWDSSAWTQQRDSRTDRCLHNLLDHLIDYPQEKSQCRSLLPQNIHLFQLYFSLNSSWSCRDIVSWHLIHQSARKRIVGTEDRFQLYLLWTADSSSSLCYTLMRPCQGCRQCLPLEILGSRQTLSTGKLQCKTHHLLQGPIWRWRLPIIPQRWDSSFHTNCSLIWLVQFQEYSQCSCRQRQRWRRRKVVLIANSWLWGSLMCLNLHQRLACWD